MREVPRQFGRSFLSLVLLCGVAGGCGDSLAPVSGRVTLDGRPVAGGTITFMPQERSIALAAAALEEDGSFQLRLGNRKNQAGAAPGAYKVTVSKTRNEGGRSIELLPPEYADHNRTPFQVEVPPEGKTDFHFELTTLAR